MSGYQSRLKTFPQRPYYDDFDVNKRFLQILFRPGLAVQARELTQMQTILQEQISRLGSHFFDNGSKIVGGEMSIKNKIEYIKLPPNFNLPTASYYDYVGGTIYNGTLLGRIVHYIPPTDTDPATIYVEYESAEGDISTFGFSGISNISITNVGNGYTGAVAVNIVGDGTGATANATILSGKINTITITNKGFGYTTAPIVNIDPPPGSGAGFVQATAIASLITNNVTLTLKNTLTNLDETYTFNINTSNVGHGAIVFINDGIYFINGRFIVVDKQVLVVSKYDDINTLDNVKEIGFLIKESIVTPEQDNSLFDNAIGSENESAPGAARYKMDAILSVKPTDDSVKDFIQILVLTAGEPQTPPSQTDYTPLFMEMFARRTYDESGDYIINDFLLDVREHLNNGSNRGVYDAGDGGLDTKVALVLDPGKAYVRGYEIETNSSTILSIDKSRDFESVEDIFVSNPYDSYLLVSDLTPGSIISSGNITTNAKFSFFNRVDSLTYLKNSSNQSIFSVILCGAENDSTTTKFYFTQLKALTPTSRLSDVLYIEQSGKKAGVKIVGGQPQIFANQNTSKLLYQIPLSYVKNITGSLFKIYKDIEIPSINTNNITIPPDATLQYTSNINNYLLCIETYGYIRPNSVSIQSNGSVVITLPNNTYNGLKCNIIAIVAKKTYTPKLKTLTTTTVTQPYYSVNALKSYSLNYVDIYKIDSIFIDGTDYTSSFELDNGQRDDMYDYGVIKLKPGLFAPNNGTISITFKYFQHGTGDFFTIDSYAALTYEQIPKYKNAFLGNYIDLRTSVSNSQPMNRVVPYTDIAIDYSYYLSRSDIIVLNSNGKFSAVRGVPSLSPKTPKDVDNSITLYELFIPAYTFNTNEIDVKKLNYKRFTMRDIANLEKRIENLEYYTQLSLLESDIQGKEFLDKFKSGFIVDNFESLTTGDVENDLHTVAIDFSNKEMRPETITKDINVEYAYGNNIARNDGIITLPFNEVEYQSQKLASTLVRLQPFTKFNWNGKITLNPSVDNWFSTVSAPDLTLDAGFFPSNQRASVVNQKIWDIAGRVFTGNEIGSNASGTVSINAGGVSNVNDIAATRIVSSLGLRFGGSSTTISTQTNYIGTRVVDSGVAPYIRRRVVEFTITGLKPNTIVKPYFDGADVSRWCFNEYPSNWEWNYVNINGNYQPTGPNTVEGTKHSSQSFIYYKGTWTREDLLVNTDVFKSNGAGVIHGWFLIPNNELARFKTGTRKMSVSDVLENPTTYADGYYAANGTYVVQQNVFVTTRFVTRTEFWYDPVAQSFSVGNPEGMFASSVDLFFGPEAATQPDWVTVQIRNMVNGYPGEHTIASIDKYVNVGSYDANTPVRFTFKHPVYLQPNNEYALVVISDSTELAVWCSELGQKSVRPGDFTTFTGEYINKQPFLGSLFKSQNNKTWTAEQTQDLKFILNRAKFNISSEGSVTFNNKLNKADLQGEGNIFETSLNMNPLSVAYGVKLNLLSGGVGYTSVPTVSVNDVGTGGSGFTATAILGTNVGVDDDKVVGFNINNIGSGYTSAPVITLVGGGASTPATIETVYHPGNRIYVRHYNHGFKTGDTVNLTFRPGVTGVILGSYTVGDLSGNKTITSTGLDYYTFDLPTTNNITVDAGGGNDIKATQVIPYSYTRILTDAIILNGTQLRWNLIGRDYFSNILDSKPTGIIEGKVVDIGGLKVIRSNNDNSLQLVGTLSSNSDYISPVIDEQRATVYVMCNRINNKYDANGVDDSVSRYATKNISLVNPSNELQCYLDLNLVTGTQVKVYCMVATEPVSVSNNVYQWNEMTLVEGGQYTDINEFKEAKWQFNTDVDFTNFVIKVVLINTAGEGDYRYRHVVPRGKRFRAIALKT